MIETPSEPTSSPRWGPLTKLAIGLTLVALAAALVVQFRSIIGPLILAFMLTYLLHPVADKISTLTRLSWRGAVNIIYLLVLVVFLSLITVSGLTIAQQIQSLYNFVKEQLNDLPALATQLSTQVYILGPFEFNFGQFDLPTLSRQLLSAVQPMLGRMGGLISSFAASAAVTVGWSLFVLVVSYFLLADAGRLSNNPVQVDLPGYTYDIQRLGGELRKIWNSYLRGQLIVILLVILCYIVLMLILGMRFAIGIAILAGLARFVPYVGPMTTTTITALVALFQEGNYFSLEPYQYALLVVAASFILDQVFDNLISPRLLGDVLGVHPAGVLIIAIIAANLIGIIGLVLAAPVLATFNLLARYVARKMFDMEPWPEGEARSAASPLDAPWMRWARRLRAWLRSLRGSARSG
ncbi:MAG: AI-2E family transporter [Chloroflexi bacterium]|nr:AI-2E family transporter [Chloroflexota bacterium]